MTEQPKCTDSRPDGKQIDEPWHRLGDQVIDFPTKTVRKDGVVWYRRIYPDKGTK